MVGTSFGVCNIVARIATIFAPRVAEMKPESISYWIFIVVIGMAFLMSFLITERPKPKDESEKVEK